MTMECLAASQRRARRTEHRRIITDCPGEDTNVRQTTRTSRAGPYGVMRMLTDDMVASVQYGDVTGTVAADAHDGALLHDLAEACGIDTAKYHPLRIKISPCVRVSSPSEDMEQGLVCVRFWVFDKAAAEKAGFEHVWEYAKEHDLRVPVLPIDKEAVSVADLFRRCNGFELVAESRAVKEKRFELIENEIMERA